MEAEPLLLAGYEGIKLRQDKNPPADKSRLNETARRLVQLYIELGKPEKAAQWKQKLEAHEPPALPLEK